MDEYGREVGKIIVCLTENADPDLRSKLLEFGTDIDFREVNDLDLKHNFLARTSLDTSDVFVSDRHKGLADKLVNLIGGNKKVGATINGEHGEIVRISYECLLPDRSGVVDVVPDGTHRALADVMAQATGLELSTDLGIDRPWNRSEEELENDYKFGNEGTKNWPEYDDGHDFNLNGRLFILGPK